MSTWQERLALYPKNRLDCSEEFLEIVMHDAEHGAEFSDSVVMTLLAEIAWLRAVKVELDDYEREGFDPAKHRPNCSHESNEQEVRRRLKIYGDI